MKKRLLIVIAALLSMGSLVSCGESSTFIETSNNSVAETGDSKQHDIYLLAVAAGYEGTYEEWLESVRGEDGITPHIGENGNWFIGAIDTGVKAEGKDGATWLHGETEPSDEIGNNNDFYFDTFSFSIYKKENGNWVLLASLSKKTETYTITLDLMGGYLDDGIETTYYVDALNTIKLPIPTKIGSIFEGWVTGFTVIDVYFTSTTPITNDMMLYAKWNYLFSPNLPSEPSSYKEVIRNNFGSYVMTYSEGVESITKEQWETFLEFYNYADAIISQSEWEEFLDEFITWLKDVFSEQILESERNSCISFLKNTWTYLIYWYGEDFVLKYKDEYDALLTELNEATNTNQLDDVRVSFLALEDKIKYDYNNKHMTVAEAIEAEDGEVVTIRGITASARNGERGFFVVDETGAIYVYDKDGIAINQFKYGNEVQITATRSSNDGAYNKSSVQLTFDSNSRIDVKSLEVKSIPTAGAKALTCPEFSEWKKDGSEDYSGGFYKVTAKLAKYNPGSYTNYEIMDDDENFIQLYASDGTVYETEFAEYFAGETTVSADGKTTSTVASYNIYIAVYDARIENGAIKNWRVAPLFVEDTFTAVYAQVPTDWEEVNIYYWAGNEGNSFGEEYRVRWPGIAMTLVNEEQNIWGYMVPTGVDHVIFNNGNIQTVNIDFSSTKNLYVLDTMDAEGKYTAYYSTYEPSEDDPELGRPQYNVIEKITMYAQVPAEWKVPSIHYWGTSTGYTTWPGVAMTEVDAEKNIYSYEVPADIGGFCLTDGAASGTIQTDILYLLEGVNAYVVTELRSDGKYNAAPALYENGEFILLD